MTQLLSLLVVVAACGGDSAAPDAKQADAKPIDGTTAGTTVTGTLGGNSFGALDAVANTVTASGFDYDAMSTDVTITTFANECSLQMSQTGTPNGRILVLVMASTDAAGHSSPVSAPGAYSVFSGTPPPSSKLVEAYYEIDGATCLKTSSEFATAGTVTLTSATAPMAGVFDFTFPDGHITGKFNAPACAALNPNATPLNGC